MDVTKEALIRRLLKENKITEDDAIVLRRAEKEVQYIQYQPTPQPAPFKPIQPLEPYTVPNYPTMDNDWVAKEIKRRMDFAANCSCRKNGGVCGCTMGSPYITVSMNAKGVSPNQHFTSNSAGGNNFQA